MYGSCVQPHRSIDTVAEPVSFVASSALEQCMQRRLLGRQLNSRLLVLIVAASSSSLFLQSPESRPSG